MRPFALAVPVSMLKPFSSLKIAVVPPPRSSVPTMPQRVPCSLPPVACQVVLPFWLLV
jgi:hypothetical protein